MSCQTRFWRPVKCRFHGATPIAPIFGRHVAESLYFHIVAADPHPMEGRQDIQGRLGRYCRWDLEESAGRQTPGSKDVKTSGSSQLMLLIQLHALHRVNSRWL